MPYPIDNKFVIAISASALFDTAESDEIYSRQGICAYKKHIDETQNIVYQQGAAFPFIRRFLSLNNRLPNNPVEVVLFTRNSPELGKRLMYSIKYYGLNISRTCFSSGEYNYEYLPAFNAALFLSGNPEHTKAAIKAGAAAGTVLKSLVIDDFDDVELRFAFDFDGIIADDEAEVFYEENGGDLDSYFNHENEFAKSPLNGGPLNQLLKKIFELQQLEIKYQIEKEKEGGKYTRVIKTAIVTARNAPADERVLTTLKNMDIAVDTAFFLGGIEKSRILNIMKPHLFFDDQMTNFENLKNVAAVHVPFGIKNK